MRRTRARAENTRAQILLYTCADKRYEDFLPLLAYTALMIDERYSVEFGVVDAEAFEAEHLTAMTHLRNLFPQRRVLIRTVAWQTPDGGHIKPNTVRFITPPLTEAVYVYITDADFMFLNNRLISQHLRFMRSRNLPYSNSVRPGTNRMSGLQFRPIPGIHMSPNREVFEVVTEGKSTPGWSTGSYATVYRDMAAHPDFQAFRRTLSPRIQNALDLVDMATAAYA